MEGCDGTPDGAPTDLTMRRYERFGAGGAGLIWAEATSVAADGRANPRQLRICPATETGFSELVRVTREAARRRFGARHDPYLVLQLTHSGRFSKTAREGERRVACFNPHFDREALPVWGIVPLMIAGGALAGSVWALVPAVLKTRYKVDDVVTTLLLNFVLYYGMMALLDGPWKDPLSGYPDSPDIRMEAEFPILLSATRLHLGVLLAALAAAGVWLLLRHTTLGFEIDAVGENPNASRYAGINIAAVTLFTAAVSGALAGLAGVGEVAGIHFQVMAGLSPGYGYTGIVIAMLARLNPIGVVPAAIFFAVIITGAEAMSRATGVPVFLADVIQGMSLITMLAALMLTQYRIRRNRSEHG
jgi:simple sugar transport system permease protein